MARGKLIPSTSEYAIRAMAQLAILQDGQAVRAEELSHLTGIPRDYLSKVLRKLVQHGLLLGEKGHGGGFRLAYAPHKISFQNIFEAMDFELGADYCAYGWKKCNSKTPCPLHESYTKLKSNFRTWASSTTLQDIDSSPSMLRRLERLAAKSLSEA
jgi:Rrf2 family protein